MVPGGAMAAWLAFSLAAAAQPAADAGAPQTTLAPGGFPSEYRYIGQAVPDIPFTATTGQTSLTKWADGQGVLVALAYTRCVGLCTPFLASLASAEALAGAHDVRTLVLSLDARDTVADMGEMAERMGLGGQPDWTFGVAAAGDVAALSSAVGFSYTWDPNRQQFDHSALLVAVRGGRVVRLLAGPDVDPARLQEVVRELRGEFVGAYPLPGRVLVRCFDYDPRSGRFSIGWGFLALVVPAACAFAGTLALFGAARRGRS